MRSERSIVLFTSPKSWPTFHDIDDAIDPLFDRARPSFSVGRLQVAEQQRIEIDRKCDLIAEQINTSVRRLDQGIVALAEIKRQQMEIDQQWRAEKARLERLREQAKRGVMYFEVPFATVPRELGTMFFRAHRHPDGAIRVTGPYVDSELLTPYWGWPEL